MNTKLIKYENQLPVNIILLDKEYHGRKNMTHKCIVCNHEFKSTANKMLKMNHCPNEDNHPFNASAMKEEPVSNYIELEQVEHVSLPISVLFKPVIKPELTLQKYKNTIPDRKRIIGKLTDINKPIQHKCSWCKFVSNEIPQDFYDRDFICKKCGKA